MAEKIARKTTNLLANEKKAAGLFAQYNALARNVKVPATTEFRGFTGCNNKEADYNERAELFKDSFRRMGVNIGSCSRSCGGPPAEKTASVEKPPIDFQLLKQAALAGYADSEANGDTETMALCKEAAMCLEAADILLCEDDMEKTAAAGDPRLHDESFLSANSPVILGSLAGAMGGAGLKYYMSDPGERKRGMLRLLDAALAGGAAGAGAGWLYKETRPGGTLTSDETRDERANRDWMRNAPYVHGKIVEQADPDSVAALKKDIEAAQRATAVYRDMVKKIGGVDQNPHSYYSSSAKLGEVNTQMNRAMHQLSQSFDKVNAKVTDPGAKRYLDRVKENMNKYVTTEAAIEGKASSSGARTGFADFLHPEGFGAKSGDPGAGFTLKGLPARAWSLIPGKVYETGEELLGVGKGNAEEVYAGINKQLDDHDKIVGALSPFLIQE